MQFKETLQLGILKEVSVGRNDICDVVRGRGEDRFLDGKILWAHSNSKPVIS